MIFFYFQGWLLIYKDAMGMGEKIRMRKGNERKNPRLVALPSPLLRYGGRLFSGVQERQKQVRLTLSGIRRGEDWLHEFILMRFQDIQKKWTGVRVGV